MRGSVALLVNNITGGSMVVFPLTFQQSGWLVPVVVLLGVCMLSTVASLMLVETMSLIPGNQRLQKRVEYTNLVDHFFPRWLYWSAERKERGHTEITLVEMNGCKMGNLLPVVV
jgi:amino acid permease